MVRKSRSRSVIATARKVRWCPACQISKPITDFYVSRGAPHGYCKSCAQAKERARHRQQVTDLFGPDEVARREAIRRKKLNAREGCKVCARCLVEKSLDNFYGIKGESYCIECRIEYDKIRHAKSPRNRLVTLLGAARKRAIGGGLPFDLELEDLVGLWEDQSGRCWYTDVELVFDGNRRPEALSVDRVNSSFGYTRDNVVLCCRRVNEMKREMTTDELSNWCRLILAHSKKE